MHRPPELRTSGPLDWSPGTGRRVWRMLKASAAGDLRRVKRLLTRHPELAKCQHAYRTPLYFAVRENHPKVAALLLERGADPLSLAVDDPLVQVARDRGYVELEQQLLDWLKSRCNASPDGEPVAAALRDRDLTRMRELLDASPELLRAGDARSNQPIHWAVMTRQLSAIDELLDRGADINAARYDGARPIHLTNGDYHYRGWRDVPAETTTTPAEVLAHLRARGADVDLSTAASTGDLARATELLDEDPSRVNRNPDYVTYYAGSGSPLRNAAGAGHLEIVRLLLERGADPNLREEGIAPHGHALYSAAANRHHEIVQMLLDHGARPNPEVESSADALSRAISNGDARMIELLASHGASRGVHLLAYDGDVRTAAAVFAADPDLADNVDALANAAWEGQTAFVQLMLRYQPKLPRRLTFPCWSVSAKSHELCELLFAHGLDPDRPDWLGIRPLHLMARQGNIERAAQYLDHGADIDAVDDDQRSTPLGWAAKFGQAAMAEFLLARGAAPNLPEDPAWARPLAWAERREHEVTARLLRQHGAR